jgi:signal peptidase I
MKMDMFVVETGSMAPTIKPYSVIYVRNYNNFEDYNVGDIVTFTDSVQQKSFTHRIVAIDELNKSFTTKGDANSENDVGKTQAEYAQGKVEVVIPYLGYFVKFLQYTVVKVVIAIIYIAWAAIEIELFAAERKRSND